MFTFQFLKTDIINQDTVSDICSTDWTVHFWAVLHFYSIANFVASWLKWLQIVPSQTLWRHRFCQITKSQMSFFGITVDFFLQKMKSKHLVCLSFLWRQVFWGNKRKYFTHIPSLRVNCSDVYTVLVLQPRPFFWCQAWVATRLHIRLLDIAWWQQT